MALSYEELQEQYHKAVRALNTIEEHLSSVDIHPIESTAAREDITAALKITETFFADESTKRSLGR